MDALLVHCSKSVSHDGSKAGAVTCITGPSKGSLSLTRDARDSLSQEAHHHSSTLTELARLESRTLTCVTRQQLSLQFLQFLHFPSLRRLLLRHVHVVMLIICAIRLTKAAREMHDQAANEQAVCDVVQCEGHIEASSRISCRLACVRPTCASTRCKRAHGRHVWFVYNVHWRRGWQRATSFNVRYGPHVCDVYTVHTWPLTRPRPRRAHTHSLVRARLHATVRPRTMHGREVGADTRGGDAGGVAGGGIKKRVQARDGGTSKRAIGVSGSPERSSDSCSRDGRTLFVGNLDGKTRHRTLVQLFSAHGAVESVRLRGGAGRGAAHKRRSMIRRASSSADADGVHAYVVFAATEGCTHAMQRATQTLHMHVLHGRRMRVRRMDKEMDRACAVFVGNLADGCTEDALFDAFENALRPHDVRVTDARVCRQRHSRRPRGVGFVEFDDERGPLLAETSALVVDGRNVRVQRVRKLGAGNKTKNKTKTPARKKRRRPAAEDKEDEGRCVRMAGR